MDRILQGILAVIRKLEGMDSAMVGLTAETRSMHLDIAVFQSQISGLDKRVVTVETQVASWTDRDQELLHLRSKLTDFEDRNRRNNIRLLGFPEGIEGTDLFSYLRDTLPKLIPKGRQAGPQETKWERPPCPIIVCLLRHMQTRQLLQEAGMHSLFRSGALEIRLSADFSKETAERRKAFLSLRTHLHHLDVKFGLFEPARMWITKNRELRNFYDPEDLRAF
ncbi:hypothetical protein NDU88_007027 [Pleurodeles waltl]|uniref:LINE-1 type transposase domain-containing 1 n=1 Tax=Pleurodeles waltl TaxID=8319 RepID=A0AAV7QLQ9_PLEWA|nr:hypothetical protein NDU88_007027 [Pleurodeles waltl]